MLFETTIGCGSLDICRPLADFLLACRPGHRRPVGNGRQEACIADSWCALLTFNDGLSEERLVSVDIQSGQGSGGNRG
jgi:hypothetical protein